MMDNKFRGYLCGIIAAVSYGTNPLGALFLYEDGLRPASVLFYRFSFAALLLALLMALRGKSLAISRNEGKVLLALGMLFAASSLT